MFSFCFQIFIFRYLIFDIYHLLRDQSRDGQQLVDDIVNSTIGTILKKTLFIYKHKYMWVCN